MMVFFALASEAANVSCSSARARRSAASVSASPEAPASASNCAKTPFTVSHEAVAAMAPDDVQD